MKTCNALLIVVCAGLCLANAATAADQPPGRGNMPLSGMASGIRGRALLIGPTDYTGTPRPITGMVRLTCRAPQNATVVEIFVDDNSISKLDKQPFSMEYDASKLSQGEHVFKAVGKDAKGAQVWSSTTKAVVAAAGSVPAPINAGPPAAALPAPGGPPAVSADGPASNSPAGPAAPSAVDAAPPGLGAPAALPAARPRPIIARPAASTAPAVALDKTYSSAKYGFSIKYPGTWTAADETASMKPKLPGGVWVVLSPKAGDPSGLVVNVRRQKLDAGTDADTFAKYNDYVRPWEKKTVLGSPAFATKTTSPGQSRFVHRLIVIKDGMAWMFNCIDKNGKDVEGSGRLFESIVNTLGAPQAAPVRVQELKPRRVR